MLRILEPEKTKREKKGGKGERERGREREGERERGRELNFLNTTKPGRNDDFYYHIEPQAT